jgi:hypothetical protein
MITARVKAPGQAAIVNPQRSDMHFTSLIAFGARP